ncbi:MAG: hypothetical protein KDB14_28585 [Planctomycetales bacterium]|nr:hypothetical protein [Planctomycetales bacterium]
MNHSLADLRDALASDRLARYLDDVGLSHSGREELSRIIAHDRHLWRLYPNSLESCLVGRLLGVGELENLRSEWVAEIRASGRPWIECLHPLRLPDGQLATLFDTTPAFSQLTSVSFLDDDNVLLEPSPYHLRKAASEGSGPLERVVWNWRTHEHKFQVSPEDASQRSSYPKLERQCGGPPLIVREAGGPSVAIPCPDEAYSHVRLDRTGRNVIVWGSLEDYAGGFIWFISIDDLRVERKLNTERPVWDVSESYDGTVALARTSNALVSWAAGRQRAIPLRAESAAVSPNGKFAVIRRDIQSPLVYQVWDLAEAKEGTRQPRLPTQFSPSGHRLLRENKLFDGATGAKLADLDVLLGQYLEGGPATPYCHLGDRLLTNLHSSMQVWSSVSGERIEAGRRRFPYWFHVAYDQSGTRLAAVKSHDREVSLYAIPSGDVETTFSIDLQAPEELALSHDGELVPIAEGAEVEVRTAGGELLLSARHPPDDGTADRQVPLPAPSLLFVSDGIASRCGEVWRLFELDGRGSRLIDPPKEVAPLRHLAGWKVTPGGYTLFEAPNEDQIALPLSGSWVVHPGAPNTLACDQCHVKLRDR